MDNQRPQDPETESLAGLLLRHRGRTGLTQRELAERLATSRRSVQDWETGASHPGAERLQALILVLLELGALTAGREARESHELWAAALRETPRMHTPLDEQWLDRLLADRAASRTRVPTADLEDARSVERQRDWDEAPDVIGFVGRAEELATLHNWVVEEHCRLAAVLGMGGIGKTALASRLALDAAPGFQFVYWRSLRNAPPAVEWMAGAISFLSEHHLVPPEGEASRLAVLLELLRERPSLLVLDNFETVLEPGQQQGRYRDGFAGYGALLHAIGERRHQSCLMVTSREAPPELAIIGSGAVHRLQLGGLGMDEAQVLLADKQLSGNVAAWTNLVTQFGGNGLALKIAGESIRQLFGGDIAAFLEAAGTTPLYGGIKRVLSEQIERGSALEQSVLTRLAIEREPVTVAELLADLGGGRAASVEAFEALRRRSLVERSGTGAAFVLQSVVQEFVTERLVQQVAEEIARGEPDQLVELPLIKARAKQYVRQSQERLIGQPIIQHLGMGRGTSWTQDRLLELLEAWRQRSPEQQGYGPGNVVNLLRLLRGHLREMDFSGLSIVEAYLEEADAQDACLAGARLSRSPLGDAFDGVTSVALDADATRVAAGTLTGDVRVWLLCDRAPLLALHGHTGVVPHVAFSADGRTVASGSLDETVRVWAADGGCPIATLRGHPGGVQGVGVSADGRVVVSGGHDGAVRVWDAQSGRSLATLLGHSGSVWATAVSGDGRLVASGGFDRDVRLWDGEAGRCLAMLPGHTDTIRAVAVSTDGRVVASGGFDATVRLWDPRSASSAGHGAGGAGSGTILEGHTGAVRSVALSADGRRVVSGGFDGTVRLWESESGRPVATLLAHDGGVRGVAISADGRIIASGGFDAKVRVWAADGRPLATLNGHGSRVWGLAISADGGTVASGGQDGTVRLWDGRTGHLVATWPLPGSAGAVGNVALSADGRIVVGSSGGRVRLWDVETGQSLAIEQGHTGVVWGVATSADGRLVASAGDDRTVRLWDARIGRARATLQGHVGRVRGVAVSGDGRTVAGSGDDGTVLVWDADTGHLLSTLRGHTGAVRSVAIGEYGREVASAGDDGQVRVWDARAGHCVATLLGHTGEVWNVALSSDGQTVVSGGQDGAMRRWDAQTGRLLATRPGNAGELWKVAISADGRSVVSAGLDGTVKLWDGTSFELQRMLRPDRRYERMDITGLTGITEVQRQTLMALGAFERPGWAGRTLGAHARLTIPDGQAN